jgi:hypothetical protein
MRARAYIAAAVLLAAAISVSAQEKDTSSDTKYSVEIGTGLQPLHTNLANGWSYKKELAETGQGIDSKGSFCPVADLTAVIRTRPRTEFTLSAGVSWYHHRVTQYSIFGTDPEGKPRYNLKDGTPGGWKDSSPVFSLTFQWRHIWNPDNAFKVYSGLGAGIVFSKYEQPLPAPSLTPAAFRYGGKHFYGFAEITVGTLATFIHGGLGWQF